MPFSPRQTYYLRTGPYTVLQVVLYLEPGPHVRWMSDVVLDRILQELKPRIPIKLRDEIKRAGKKTGGTAREKLQVDVYRGVGFQMAYFFRQSAQRHAVLLKDKEIELPDPQEQHAHRSPKRRRTEQPGEGSGPVQPQDDDDVIVKDEPQDDTLPLRLSPSLDDAGREEAEVELDLDEDQKPDAKPTLTVNYKAFSIYRRSLVVVVEPWPPLKEGEYQGPAERETEVRQLSASVAPRSTSVASTPGPLPRRRESQTPLFRMETTPLSDFGDPSTSNEAEQDSSWRGLREASAAIANEWQIDDDDEEDLPQLARLAPPKNPSVES